VRKPDPGRIAPLARLKVGTKLMLLVLLPVCVLLGFTGFTALADWHAGFAARPAVLAVPVVDDL